MIKGIIIFEHGGVQAIGELNSFAGIINTMEQLLPDLRKQEIDRVFNTLSPEQIAALIKQKEETQVKTGKTEKLKQ